MTPSDDRLAVLDAWLAVSPDRTVSVRYVGGNGKILPVWRATATEHADGCPVATANGWTAGSAIGVLVRRLVHTGGH